MFRAALDETIERIAYDPLQFRLVRAETRRAILNRFPDAVYFRVAGNDIVVLAVHGRQHGTAVAPLETLIHYRRRRWRAHLEAHQDLVERARRPVREEILRDAQLAPYADLETRFLAHLAPPRLFP